MSPAAIGYDARAAIFYKNTDVQANRQPITFDANHGFANPPSGGLGMVIVQQPSKSCFVDHATAAMAGAGAGLRDAASDALVGSLCVVVQNDLPEGMEQSAQNGSGDNAAGDFQIHH